MRTFRCGGSLKALAGTTLTLALLVAGSAAADDKAKAMMDKGMDHMGMMSHATSVFRGVSVNSGTATHTKNGGHNVLTLSDDFKVPDAPAPHWQVVDSKGNVYLLQRLTVKDNKYNKSITLPSYVGDVAKVQIWCSFAEALLGEASFEKPVK
jgi:hypothetical protein